MRWRAVFVLAAAFAAGLAAAWIATGRRFQPAPAAAGGGISGPAAMRDSDQAGHQPGALDPATLSRLREATVFVQTRGVSYVAEGDAIESSGSGFLVTSDGRILTNWHVVAPGRQMGEIRLPYRPERIEAVLMSGTPRQKVFPARLLAGNPDADLALLKIEAGDCPFLDLGDSDALVETTPVWVVGFPLGKVFSVLHRGPEISISHGCVTSLRHDDRGRLERIQLDAAVTPGNSGGPLVLRSGKAVGIVNMALGASRINFAVPAATAREWLAGCPLKEGVGESCTVEITGEPEGAEAFIDGRPVGRIPLRCTAAAGERCVQVRAPGRRTWTRATPVWDGRRIEARPAPMETATLDRDGSEAPANSRLPGGGPDAPPGKGNTAGTALERGPAIFREDFEKPSAIREWRQETGGEGMRTWYAEDGMLHQHSEDGLLHAIIAGDREWSDFALSARVRIHPGSKDGRAGLIFAAGEDGFLLFRLHSATSQVQLAWHMKDPFGWQIVRACPLPRRAGGDEWRELQVQAMGRRAVCLVDGAVCLDAWLPIPARGRIGFYSVDSKASFDDVLLSPLKGNWNAPPPSSPPLSFWFTENFNRGGEFWRSYEGEKPAPPWPVIRGACLRLDGTGTESINLLERFEVRDGLFRVAVACGSGEVGLVFRHGGGKYCLFSVAPAENRAELFLVEAGSKKKLASADPVRVGAALEALATLQEEEPREGEGGGEPPGSRRPSRLLILHVLAIGNRISAGVNNAALLEASDGTPASGKIGLYSKGGKAVFVQVHANSARPQG
ncbi:MAG: trypsin-like peptidase domain-containing protein [Planctomycetota bacterium]|nr:trypsin-like peptidase domain-containing protein [Planctomycetota bacterium]